MNNTHKKHKKSIDSNSNSNSNSNLDSNSIMQTYYKSKSSKSSESYLNNIKKINHEIQNEININKENTALLYDTVTKWYESVKSKNINILICPDFKNNLHFKNIDMDELLNNEFTSEESKLVNTTDKKYYDTETLWKTYIKILFNINDFGFILPESGSNINLEYTKIPLFKVVTVVDKKN
jgi:uncharacterized protein YbaR (Trm112 family)